MKNPNETPQAITFAERDFTELLHPAQAFVHPQAVVDDPGLTLNEKRAVLAAWASDACAGEASPALRRAPGSARVVSVDEILESLCKLDRAVSQHCRAVETPPVATGLDRGVQGQAQRRSRSGGRPLQARLNRRHTPEGQDYAR
jgi:hypothetical protein